MNQFHHIGIIGKNGAAATQSIIERTAALLTNRGIAYTLDAATVPAALADAPESRAIADWPADIDLAIVIGGDGTFLYAGRALHAKNIPLVGINAGRLGFLADLSADALDKQLAAILSGEYSLERRQILAIRVHQHGKTRACYHAMNDLVIHKRSMARMVELDAYTRGEFLCHYHADGLILSTPTGSTAYALSAGGPIVEPTLNALIIAPICPHTLNHRPVVISADSGITVTLGSSNPDIQITVDGQVEFILEPDDIITTEHGGTLTVLHPKAYRFQQRLREKLNWGLSPEKNRTDHA